ncbi:MAG: hypothetical protein WD402_10225 [Chloroflexota bacterium]
MKRRREQERDEAIAREQADARQEALLAELKARQTTTAPVAEPPPAEAELDEPEPSATDEPTGADEVPGAESKPA